MSSITRQGDQADEWAAHYGGQAAETTTVRLHLLDCGHIVWCDHPVSEPSTINHCLACAKPARVECYLDEQAIRVLHPYE